MLCFSRLSTVFIHTKVRETLVWSSLLPFPSSLWSVNNCWIVFGKYKRPPTFRGRQESRPPPSPPCYLRHATLTADWPESATCINILQRAHNAQALPVWKVWWATLCLFRPLVPNFGCTLKSPGGKKSPGDILNDSCLSPEPKDSELVHLGSNLGIDFVFHFLRGCPISPGSRTGSVKGKED